MAKFKSEVGGYRGRRTLTDILKIVAGLLAVLVVLMGAALIFGQRYIVYTDDGLELDIPFLQQEEPPVADVGDISILEQPEPVPAPEPIPEPAPEPEPVYMKALQLPVDSVLDGTAAEKLAEQQADALVLEMKAQSGKLSWVSEEKLAKLAKANPEDDGVNEALRQWNEGDVYTIARVCCFRDDSLPYHCNRVALRTAQGNWRDEAGMRHLDPTDQEAQQYIIGLCIELAELGFDEILLEYCGYPVRGKLDRILPPDGDPFSHFEGIEFFLGQVNEAMQPYKAVFSVSTEVGILTGETEGSGLDCEALWSLPARLWLNGADFGYVPEGLREYIGHREAEDFLVALTDEMWQDSDCHQAFLGE